MSIPVISSIAAYFYINILLQAFDGVLTYQVLSMGIPEANPLVNAAIEKWGALWGLLYWKTLACVLLLLIYALRQHRPKLAMDAFIMTATVYAWFGLLSFCELFLPYS